MVKSKTEKLDPGILADCIDGVTGSPPREDVYKTTIIGENGTYDGYSTNPKEAERIASSKYHDNEAKENKNENNDLELKVNEEYYSGCISGYHEGKYSKLEKIGGVILAIPLVAYCSVVAIAYAIGITAVLCTAYLVFSAGCN